MVEYFEGGGITHSGVITKKFYHDLAYIIRCNGVYFFSNEEKTLF